MATAMLWLGSAMIAGTVMRGEVNEAYDESLRQSAFRLLPLAIHDLGESEDHDEAEERQELQIDGLEAANEGFTYFVRNAGGTIIIAAGGGDDDMKPVSASDGFFTIDGKRQFAFTDSRSGYGIVVIERTDHRAEALNESVAALIWPLAALLPLLGTGIWIAIRLAMRPVEQLRKDLATRDGNNLAPVSGIGHPVELAPIALAVADLLERLRMALDAERAFAASSAHELRTPIAGALAQVQQLSLEIGDSPGSARLGEIETALRRLADLSEKLLQLSRLDAGFAKSEAANDLLPVLQLVVRDFQRDGRMSGRVRLHAASETKLIARINSDAFAIALGNLLKNAMLHGQPDGIVDVDVGPDGIVRVTNSGPVVAAEILGRLGERFERGASPAPGTGLGLSIARSIVEQTGGSLVLRSPATGRNDGFEAIIRLQYPSPSDKCRSI